MCPIFWTPASCFIQSVVPKCENAVCRMQYVCCRQQSDITLELLFRENCVPLYVGILPSYVILQLACIMCLKHDSKFSCSLSQLESNKTNFIDCSLMSYLKITVLVFMNLISIPENDVEKSNRLAYC